MDKKRALLLGGTGAMGVRLQALLADRFAVTVTSRSERESTAAVTFVKGNAKDTRFLKEILAEKWDVIVDFMVYSTGQFQKRVELFLNATDQYVYFSSARVFADAGENRICEESPRLLDTVDDQDYLATDEYALAKARQEDILTGSGRTNWTIVRPTLTYNTSKLQLGAYEKENWLYRALKGRSIVFSKDLLDITSTMSHGDDVAQGVAALAGRPEALGQSYNIMGVKTITWAEVLGVYLDVLEKHLGKRPNVVITERCTNLQLPSAQYKLKYGRYFHRYYDSSKIGSFVDNTQWVAAREGLAQCLTDFLAAPRFGKPDWRKEALIDRAAKEKTPLSEIKGSYNRFTYICYKYNLRWLHALAEKAINGIKKHR